MRDGARIDAAEVARERLPRHLGDGARHLDAGGPPPTITKVRSWRRCSASSRSARPARRRTGCCGGCGLHPRCALSPARTRPSRHDRNTNASRRSRGPGSRRETDSNSCARCGWRCRCRVTSAISTVALRWRAQDVPDRPGHVGGRQRRGRHLVEKRLKAMIVLLVDDRNVGRARAAQRLRRRSPPKPAPRMPPRVAAVSAWTASRLPAPPLPSASRHPARH